MDSTIQATEGRAEGLDPDTRRKLEEVITILRGLSKQVPGL